MDGYWDRSCNDRYFADYGIIKLAPNTAGRRVGDVVGMFSVFMDGDRYTANRFTIGYPTEGMYSAANAAISTAHGQCRDEACLPYFCWSPPGQLYNWESTGYYRSLGFGCYGAGGWSGGPVFQYADGQYSLVSVVSTGWNHVNYTCSFVRCIWYGQNSWGPTFRYDRFLPVWRAAQ